MKFKRRWCARVVRIFFVTRAFAGNLWSEEVDLQGSRVKGVMHAFLEIIVMIEFVGQVVWWLALSAE